MVLYHQSPLCSKLEGILLMFFWKTALNERAARRLGYLTISHCSQITKAGFQWRQTSYLAELKPWRFPHCQEEILVLWECKRFCLEQRAQRAQTTASWNHSISSFASLVSLVSSGEKHHKLGQLVGVCIIQQDLWLAILYSSCFLSLPFETTNVESRQV